jgi:hypothetical protein
MTPTTIRLRRGETLQIAATAKTPAGTVVDLAAGGYEVAAEAIGPMGARVDFSPTLDEQGRVIIDHDTVAMPLGEWFFDIRLTSDTDQFSQALTLLLTDPITPPSAR